MDGEASVRKAYESILDGDYEAAIGWFDAAISASPDNPDYHYKCSITCARSGKWAKALAHAEEAARLDGGGQEEFGLHLRTVRAKLMLLEAERRLGQGGDPGEAIGQLEEAVRLDPLLLEAYLLLGHACGNEGRYDDAVGWLRAAIELDPGNGTARRWFAEYSRKRRSARNGLGRGTRRRNR